MLRVVDVQKTRTGNRLETGLSIGDEQLDRWLADIDTGHLVDGEQLPGNSVSDSLPPRIVRKGPKGVG